MGRCVRLAIVALAAIVAMPLLAPSTVAAQEDEARFRALVFSKVTNFFHESIPYGIAAIEALGDEHDFEVVATDDASIFNDDDLATFDVVVFNNTNSTPAAGDLLDTDEREAFIRYIQDGGGWAGLHSASGSERDWEWYEGLVGTMFTNHPPGQLPDGTIPGRVNVTDRVHPSTGHLPEVWRFDEEWYNFAPDPSPDVHVLAQIDTKIGIEGLEMGHHHPFAWCQNYDGGRSWYTAGGHSPEAFDDTDYLAHLLGGIEWAAGVVDGDCGATVEGEFEKTLLTDDLVDPMEVSIAPDGEAFVIERGGAIKALDPDSGDLRTVGELEVAPLEHTLGLNGLALDPDFADNGWLYVYYTAPDEPVHRLSRLTMDDDILDMGSESILLEVPIQVDHNAHEAGSMAWDGDGNLFLATGDNTAPTLYSPIDERPGQEHLDAQMTSGNTNDLRGKILRITPTDDGSYTVPGGNLFDGDDSDLTRPEIYTMGHRQPYRIHYDEPSGRLLWGDVGEDAGEWSETRGPLGLDDFQFTTEPTNAGWPYCNGRYAYLEFDYETDQSGDPFDCDGGPVNTSPNNTGLEQLPPVDHAQIWYPYDWSNYEGEAPWPELGNGGRLALGGPVYRYDPDLESDTKFPEYYDGKWFIAEWARGWIKTASIAEQDLGFDDYPDVHAGDVYAIDPWLDSETLLRPHDLEFGPEGSLYLIEWGSNYGGAGRGEPNDDSGLYRIDYLSGSRPPVAHASASPDSGPVPLEVEFSSEGTSHPEEIPYTIEWDFGDGATSTDPDPTHVYEEAGSYTATLTVTDEEDRQAHATVQIEAGNTRPEVTIDWPLHGGFVGHGDIVRYDVLAEDAEDGSTADGGIACDDVTTQASLAHDDHDYELAVHEACEGEVQLDVVEGHAWDDDVWYLLDASYTDQGAPDVGELTGEDQILLQPKRKQAEHFTASDGVGTVALGPNEGSEQQLGGTVVGQITDGSWVSYDPVNLHGIDELTFHGNSAGPGGMIEARADAPDGPLVAEPVEMPNTGDNWRANFVDVTTEVVDPPEGPFVLYLVFSSIDDTPSDLFNLHWIDFVGDGMTERGVDVEAMSLAADLPLVAGHENAVSVQLANRSDTDLTVTADVATPEGWVTEPATVTIDASETATADVTVIPPSTPQITTLTGFVHDDDELIVRGEPELPVITAPSGDDAALALDGGAVDSPVLDTYDRLSPEELWDEDTGYGWVGDPPEDRDRGQPDDLRRDFVLSEDVVTLRVSVPPGEHVAHLLRGDNDFSSGDTFIEIDGEQVTGGDGTLSAGVFQWVSFGLDGGADGTTVDLEIAGDSGNFWRVNAFVLMEDDGGPTEPGPVTASLDPADPDGDDGWYVSPVSLLLSSDDDSAGLAWRHAGDDDWIEWTEPVVFDDDGQHAIEYLDAAGDGGDSGEQVTVRVGEQGDTFTPDELTVAQGDTVLYELAGGFHNVVVVDEDGAEIDRSGDPGSNWGSWEFAANEIGVFTFLCEPHPGMEGTLTVEEGDGGGDEPGVGTISFQIDQTPPETSVSLAGEQDGDAYVDEVQVSLEADDTTSGVGETWYRVDDGEEQSYDGVVEVSGEGSHTAEFRSRDVAGNLEDWQSVEFEIVEDDGPTDPPPSIEIGLNPEEPDGPDGAYISPVTVSLSSEDADASLEWRDTTDGDWVVYEGPVTFSEPGTYTIEAQASNDTGTSEIASVSFEIVEDDDGPVDPPHDEVCSRHQGDVTFPDSAGSGHGFFIDCLAALGVVEGMTDGRFRPADDVSRGQLASFVVRAIETATGETLEAGGALFPDVGANSTHGEAITKLRNAGIIRGYEDGTFRPNASVSRDQTTRYVVGALELVLDASLETSGIRFPDVTSSQYVVDIDKLATAGVVGGFTDGTFGPRQPVTRGQMARFIGNSLEVLADRGHYHGP